MVVATQMTPNRNEKIRELEIPVIDLSGQRSKVASLIVKACEEYGFFKVVNHGVPHHIIRLMEDESFAFFNRPLPEKQRAGPANPFGYGNKNIGHGGDTGDLEYLLLQAKDAFIAKTSQLVSNAPSKFSCAASSYVGGVKELGGEILELMAQGLGVPRRVFSHLVTDSDSDSLLRLNHYPPVADKSPRRRGAMGFGEHSDPQILTLLASNGQGGLQISLGNGVWAPVAPDPHAFCVNVGDVLQAMTNGRFMSVRHRVVANSSTHRSRLSMVFFSAPPPDVRIVCPQEILKRNKPLYRPFTWTEYKSHAYAHRLGESRLDHFKLA